MVLLGVLEAAGVRLIFLPTYSPELNPCELCFCSDKELSSGSLERPDGGNSTHYTEIGACNVQQMFKNVSKEQKIKFFFSYILLSAPGLEHRRQYLLLNIRNCNSQHYCSHLAQSSFSQTPPPQ